MCSFFWANAQEITGVIKNHEKTEMDMVLMLFGMDNPISIGTADAKGHFTASLENVSLDNIPEENLSIYMSELYSNFFFNCSDIEAFGVNSDNPAARQDYVRLTNNGEWTGTAYLVSDENLIPWLEDSGYNDAIKGSFYEIIYVTQDMEVNTTCNSSVYATDDEQVETEYTFNLQLKKGFNWVEYTIEEVYETDPAIRASFPSKVTIGNLEDSSKMLWIGRYY
ncbi:hypothetical protein ADICYQ_0997 [Cyclobacterium qasimii M12-11B]|uniref:Uncharacterized protein n=3 Tax=Cyclobacterium qasimii TaxID=1350429 RepID=S7X382_9BACT|nr:hypothetical protein ADICYQ_0997 [Cyclobacterium qasimii M12-11B]GEO22254.1 hypothetical protein CQA01_27880 [Cyclobacterium qasimii]